jgi:zinc transport system permease protein
MAVGILFVSQTPGYNTDLMSFLFGNILMVSGNDLWLMGALDICIVIIVTAFYNKFLGVCFDDEFARLRGITVELYYLLLLCLTALTVVVLVSVVGIVMVIALLTLPTAIASFFCKNLIRMMLMSAGLCALFTLSGLVVSYGPDFPAGATAIVIAGVAYVVVLTIKSIFSLGHSA